LGQQLPRGFLLGVPDLAVEVISPDDSRREVADKVNMWLAHGTSVVWVADPVDRTVAIHRVGQPRQILGLNDAIGDEPLLPGFELSIARIFT